MAKTTTFTDPQVEMAALEARAEAVRLSAQGATWHELETAHAAVETAKASGDINGVTLAIGRFATIVTALEDAFGITPAATPATPTSASTPTSKAKEAAKTATQAAAAVPPQGGTAPAEPAPTPTQAPEPTPLPIPTPQGGADTPAWAQQLVTSMGEVKSSVDDIGKKVASHETRLTANDATLSGYATRIGTVEGRLNVCSERLTTINTLLESGADNRYRFRWDVAAAAFFFTFIVLFFALYAGAHMTAVIAALTAIVFSVVVGSIAGGIASTITDHTQNRRGEQVAATN